MGPEGRLGTGEIPRFVEDVGASGSSLFASARGRRTIPPGANGKISLEGARTGWGKEEPGGEPGGGRPKNLSAGCASVSYIDASASGQ